MVLLRRLAAALAALVLLAACDGDPSPGALDDRPATASPSAAPTADDAPASGRPAARSRALAVYWLGAADEPRGPRLYREWVPASAGDRVRVAVTRALAGPPADPDYTTLWAAGTVVRSVRRDGSTTVLDLSRQALVNGGGSGFEAMSLQQLVHTVTANDPAARAVQVLVEGRRVETLWGAVDLRRPVRRAPAAEVLAPVWLDVAEGGAVARRFGGSATVFEATVSWDLRRGGRVVDEGFATATAGAPARGTWTAELDAPPGDYELRAWESSAEDGSVTWLDTKRVRVTR